MNWEAATPPLALQSWLNETGSLTARLEQQFGPIVVDMQFEGEAQLYAYEQAALQVKQAWVREVILRQHASGLPLLWARSGIPDIHNPANPWQSVREIGQKPLGSLLFALKEVKRTPFFQGKILHLEKNGETPLWHGCWGRWHILEQGGFTLLLTEIFLFEGCTP